MEVENSCRERILLVDDEASVIKIVKRLLEHLGYQVTAHLKGKEALERFKAGPEDFDLVITDFSLPDLAGDQFAREVAAISPETPVIICTGYSECMSREEIDRLGIKGILVKPFKLSEIRRMLERILYETA